MSEDLARLSVYLEARLDQYEKQMKKAAGTTYAATRKIEAATQNMESKLSASFARAGISASESLMASFKGVAPAIGAALSVDAIITAADGWTNLTNRLRGFGLSAEEAAKAQENIVSIAEKSRTAIGSVGDLYGKLTLATKSLGFSQSEVVTMTETVTKALKISGASSQEAAAATLQLGQALASGKLQGDELRSILENAPMLARFIAQEFGVTVGQLKTLGAEGKLAADGVARALVKAAPEIDTAFSKTKATWADTITSLKNGFVEFIGILKAAVSESRTFATASEEVAQRVKAARDNSGLTADDKARAAAKADAALQKSLSADLARAQSEMEFTRRQIARMASQYSSTGELDGISIGGKLNISTEEWQRAFELIQSGLKGGSQAAIEATVSLEKLGRINPDFGVLAKKFDIQLEKLAKLEIAATNAGAALSKMANAPVAAPVYKPPAFSNGFDKSSDSSGIVRQEAVARGILDSEIVNSKLTDSARAIKNKIQELKSELIKSGVSGFVPDDALQSAAETIVANNNSSKASDKPVDTGGGGVSALDRQIESIRRRSREIESETAIIGRSSYEADRARAAFDLLEAAKESNVKITPELQTKIDMLATSYASAKQNVENMTAAQESMKALGQELGQSMTSFFSDMVSGGKNAEDAVMNLTKRLADMAFQAAFMGTGPMAALFGTKDSGGIFGSLISSFPGFANGTNSAPGGLAMVGERGPELVNLPRGSQVIPNIDTRKMMQGGGGTVINVNQTFTADSNPRELAQVASSIKADTLAAFTEMVGRGAMNARR